MMVNREPLANHLPTPLNYGDTMLGSSKSGGLLPYYTVGGVKRLTAESIGILAWNKQIKIEMMTYEFNDLESNDYILAECKAVNPAGDSAIGACVEKQGKHALAVVFSKVQRQAIEQLIPQSEIKAALGYDVNGFEAHRLINHYNAAFAAKKALDKTKKVSHKGFWQFVEVESRGRIKNWTELKQEPKLCCRVAALLNHLKQSHSEPTLFFKRD